MRQSIGSAARIRRRHAASGGELTADLLVTAASEYAPALLTAAVVTAAMLAPLIAMGDVAGAELVHGAAIVIASGLAVATGMNLLVLPPAYLAAGPVAVVPADELEQVPGELETELLAMQLATEPEA
jgi:Cu/Ag efflux pump CusA